MILSQKTRFNCTFGAICCILAGCEPDKPITIPALEESPSPTVIIHQPSGPTVEIHSEAAPTATPVPTPEPDGTPRLDLPPAPILTVEGHELLLEFETGGRSGYNPRPEWPKGASGVTIGVGYDLGYSSRAVIVDDWKALDPKPLNRLAATAGITGGRAGAITPQLNDIIVRWSIAVDVFDNIDVARWHKASQRALPGFDALRLNCQAALISLGFNRGWSFGGPNRAEMRDIRDYGVPKQDYPRIASAIRKMERLWRGTVIERGMTRRREAEASLVETP